MQIGIICSLLGERQRIAEGIKLKKIIKHALPKFKSDYYANRIELEKQDPKKFWRHVNTLLNKKVSTVIHNVKDPQTGFLETGIPLNVLMIILSLSLPNFAHCYQW